jgi:hypothetical protein
MFLPNIPLKTKEESIKLFRARHELVELTHKNQFFHCVQNDLHPWQIETAMGQKLFIN